MAIPYPYTSSNVVNLHTASYVDQTETQLFVKEFAPDLWYGFSETDVIELSVFDLDQNQIGWDTLEMDKTYRQVSLSYLNTLDRPIQYSYWDLLSNFILYKNTQILVNPAEQLSSSFEITEGSYVLAYNFTREMAGDPRNPLVVKDISPSKLEVKLSPLGGNTPRYEAFCRKKFQIKDVAPLLLRLTTNCPYDTLYNEIKVKYSKDINFLKNLMFLTTDGAFVNFLKTLYEDVVLYTAPENADQAQERIKRTQGIRTYFSNYLLSNYETISDFEEIQARFSEFTVARISKLFTPYGNRTEADFVSAKEFLFNFFATEFYWKVSTPAYQSFNEKYFSYLRNALNLGEGTLFTIINHGFLDERVNSTDPLTLIVKLKKELPDDIKIQTKCWVSNISLAPYVVNVIVKNPSIGKTFRIGSPNFALESQVISTYNSNTTYTAADLQEDTLQKQNIDVSKKVNELSVDYSSFTNFVLFSSAEVRTSLYKTKVVTWTNLSASLTALENTYTQSLINNLPYSHYENEKTSIESQMNGIVASFDGYESYLFQSGSYAYNPTLQQFYSTSYVTDKDEEARLYDKSNRDSLINNTPDHIVLDEKNDDYLMFLSMVGHYFDNLYLYITNLPTEKNVDNDPTKTLSKKMVDHMLESFGWKLDTTFEDASLGSSYLTSVSSSMSHEEQTKSIRTRVLSTLPQIYKTKGTEEALRMITSCYGIPSNLLSIREYGNNDYFAEGRGTYTKDERICMYEHSGSTYIEAYYLILPKVRTSEFKLVLNYPEKHTPLIKYSVHHASNYYINLADVSHPIVTRNWTLGFWREYGDMGRIYLEFGSGSVSLGKSNVVISSSLLPIFSGDIFNVMLRRNEPNFLFQTTTNSAEVPTQYDLVIQRNEYGRQIFRDETSKIIGPKENYIFDGVSVDTATVTSSLYGHHYWGNFGSVWYGKLGNIMVWDVPISDADFETHCNDFNSYAYSGSDAEKHLITRFDAEEPKILYTEIYTDYYLGQLSYSDAVGALENKSEYYSTLTTRYANVLASGSWIGTYSGSMPSLVVFSGSHSGSLSGSLSGSAIGYFVYMPSHPKLSPWTGSITGSVTGSFVGTGSGNVTSNNGAFVPVASYEGTWRGTVTGSFSGSFIGYSTALTQITGSSGNPFIAFSGSSYPAYSFGASNGWAKGKFTGSYVQSYTGSYTALYKLPIVPYGTSIWSNIFATNPTYEWVQDSCSYQWIANHYPYGYYVDTIHKTFETNDYGPNRYKNEKINTLSQNIAARLDDKDRSTYNTNYVTTTDSNLLGIFVDPQDAKNRDIIKHYGNYDFIDVIADPSDLFSSSYVGLKTLNDSYNSYGNRKVLYNELMALYKIYFNRSIFETVKGLTPARASVRTGILVEPTILERPKYQHRPVASEMNTGSVFYYDTSAVRYFRDVNTKVVRVTESLIHAEFNLDTALLSGFNQESMPPTMTASVDFSYLNEVNFIYPSNLVDGNINDFPDDVQQGNYGSIGGATSYGIPEAWGVTLQDNLRYSPHHSGSSKYFLVKKWDKYTIFTKTGSYVRNSFRPDDIYTTQSTYLYSLVVMTEEAYNGIFYTSSYLELSGSNATPTEQTDAIYIGGQIYYQHRANTGKKTPNFSMNNVNGTLDTTTFGYPIVKAPFFQLPKCESSFFEVAHGYPRNHYTHKSMQFSPVRFQSQGKERGEFVYDTFIKSRETVSSTIGLDGLEDGTLPVQTIETSNVNLVQGDNVINQ